MADPKMNWFDWHTWLYLACGLVGLIFAFIIIIPIWIAAQIMRLIDKIKQ
jgi:hypothetical protein